MVFYICTATFVIYCTSFNSNNNKIVLQTIILLIPNNYNAIIGKNLESENVYEVTIHNVNENNPYTM